MSCDHSGDVSLRSLAEMFMIDTSDVGPADGRRFHLDQNFAVPGDRHIEFSQFHGMVPGENRAEHCAHRFTILVAGWFSRRCNFAVHIPQIFPVLVVFPEKHLPLYEPAVLVDP